MALMGPSMPWTPQAVGGSISGTPEVPGRLAPPIRRGGRHRAPTAGVPAGAVPVEMAMFQLHPSALRVLGDESDLNLAGEVRVGLDLPLRADVPAEHDPVGWFVGQDPRPAAFAAIHAPVIDVTTDLRF